MYARPFEMMRRNAASFLARKTASSVMPVSAHGRRSSWIHRKYSGHEDDGGSVCDVMLVDGHVKFAGLQVKGMVVGS